MREGVFIISLYNFGGTATREMRTALREFVASDTNRLVLDLRANPGGYLDAAVDIASWFLPLGKTVVIEDYGSNEEERVHRSKGYNIREDDWRIAVLIDGGSASASEILAGALQEHGVAVLIGEQTFGKGSVQELLDITPETSLKVTVARWLTPYRHSISAAGLAPDLAVPLSVEDLEAQRDPQLEAALTYVRTGELVAPAGATTERETGVVDMSEEVE
jgi:carboxyl-terminal processing protease